MRNKWSDEKVSCEYCEKTVKLGNMKNWLRLSDVSGDMENNSVYFCGLVCLNAWTDEKEDIILARAYAQIRDKLWLMEEDEK